MVSLTNEEWLAIEQMAFHRLVEEAKDMTSLGLEGEDNREPRTAAFIDILLTKTATNDEAFKFSQKHWPFFKANGYLNPRSS